MAPVALGSLFSARMHEAGHDVSLLARGERLAALRRHGVQLAKGDSPAVRRVPVPAVAHPAGGYDLVAVFVRTHQVDAVLESLAGLDGDVLFLLNWAAGAEPLGAVIGHERVLLGFPTFAGTMDGDVVRYRATSLMTRLFPMPIGEPDGRTTPRLERIVRAFRTAGINAKAEPQMDAYLKTHTAFEVPLGQAVNAAGGPAALADDPDAVRGMIRLMRQNLAAMPTPPVPRGFVALQTLPEVLLVAMLRRFLRSPTAAQLDNASPAARAELERMAEQMRACARVRQAIGGCASSAGSHVRREDSRCQGAPSTNHTQTLSDAAALKKRPRIRGTRVTRRRRTRRRTDGWTCLTPGG
ncbi:2-dehydropantoate 2-reductase N-terminal domain-containing protein [Sorangium sp. So ce315]